jgi:hypothetical protein
MVKYSWVFSQYKLNVYQSFLVEISFLAVMCSVLPSIAMVSPAIKSASLRKETKSLKRFLIPMDFVF